LQYKKGVGAFVAGKPLEHDMSELFSFTEKARRGGLTPETRVLRFEPARHAELGDVIYLERLRSADGVPVIFERRRLVMPLCAGLTRELAEGSLYAALKTLGIEVSHAEQRARAVSPSAEERTLLKVKFGDACLRVEGRGYAADGVIWEENTLFRGDRYEIHGILGPCGTSTGRIIK
jgi:DNA-binding GntR family transcriptional regulator